MPNTNTDLLNTNLSFEQRVTNNYLCKFGKCDTSRGRGLCSEPFILMYFLQAGGNGGKKWYMKVIYQTCGESSIPNLGDFHHKPWNKTVFCITLKGTIKKANSASLPNWHRFLWNMLNNLLKKCRVTCFLELVFNQFIRRFLGCR